MADPGDTALAGVVMLTYSERVQDRIARREGETKTVRRFLDGRLERITPDESKHQRGYKWRRLSRIIYQAGNHRSNR